MDDKFRPAYDGIVEQLGAQGTPWGRFTEEQMISLPVEKHLTNSYRKLAVPGRAGLVAVMLAQAE